MRLNAQKKNELFYLYFFLNEIWLFSESIVSLQPEVAKA